MISKNLLGLLFFSVQSVLISRKSLFPPVTSQPPSEDVTRITSSDLSFLSFTFHPTSYPFPSTGNSLLLHFPGIYFVKILRNS